MIPLNPLKALTLFPFGPAKANDEALAKGLSAKERAQEEEVGKARALYVPQTLSTRQAGAILGLMLADGGEGRDQETSRAASLPNPLEVKEEMFGGQRIIAKHGIGSGGGKMKLEEGLSYLSTLFGQGAEASLLNDALMNCQV